MTTSITHQVDDLMEVIVPYYPGICTQTVPKQEAAKPRRRRHRKRNGEASGGGAKRRTLSAEQINMLEHSFVDEHKLEAERKVMLASLLGIDARQVAVWFQNRRARWKAKKLEEEHSKLKAEHGNTVAQKCQLEIEVLDLKWKLCEAEKEIQRLLTLVEGNSSNNTSSLLSIDAASNNNPSSLLSKDAMEPLFLEEFGAGGFENVFYVTEKNCSTYGMGWNDLYA